MSNPQSGTYNARIPTIPNTIVPSEPFVFTNSWQSIDVKVPGKSFRFITTHLDALDSSGTVSGFQAKELLAGPANTPLPVIVAGDFNSGPKTAPNAYNALAGGLTDTWVAAGLGEDSGVENRAQRIVPQRSMGPRCILTEPFGQ